jgi:hypothetical protein
MHINASGAEAPDPLGLSIKCFSAGAERETIKASTPEGENERLMARLMNL